MKNILKILQISRPLHGLMYTIGFLIVITALLDLSVPIISKFIVDEIVLHINHQHGHIEKLTILIVLAFVLSIIGLVLATITNRLGDHFGGKLRQFLTEKFYGKVLTLPHSYFDSEVSGKIVNQLNRGISATQGFLNAMTNFMLPMFLQSVFTIFVLGYYNLPIAIFTFLLFPVYFIISYYSAKKWGMEEVKKNAYEDISRGRISETVSNISLVKGFTSEKYEYSFLSKTLTTINNIYGKQSKSFHIYDFMRGASLNIILTLVNIVVFYRTFQGQLTIGEMVLILQLFNQARRPLFAMSFILTQIQAAESGSKEFLEILAIPSSEEFQETEKYIKKLQNPVIKFANVVFKYEKSEVVLDNVSFTIAKKEKVALVGHSGAGKSTIINLILKFYNPTSGSIFLNNKKYKDLSHTFIRENIALVFQENELFSSTIRENVAYGKQSASEEDIINALKLANAYDFVTKLPKGLDSEVGERGVRLSGGQKQRVQIARAILKNAPILILDEATSSLDAKSEKEVQDALENLMKEKLVIIIAHRFSTIQNVQKIITINDGKIVDYGSPQALANKKGIYSDLLKFQIEGNKKLLESFDIY